MTHLGIRFVKIHRTIHLGLVLFSYLKFNKEFTGASCGGSDGKGTSLQWMRSGFTPSGEDSPGGGNGNPLQYSRLENPMDRVAWRAKVYGVVSTTNWHLKSIANN